MRELVIAGNWKLNLPDMEAFASALSAVPPRGVRVIIFPPFPYIERAAKTLGVDIGAQDLSERDAGAYTGEVSASMIRNAGAKFALAGHSERRRYHGETDETVRNKTRRALDAGLHPVVCVGETSEERARGETLRVLRGQIKGALGAVAPEEMPGVLIAYEPVWAIGSGVSASPSDAREACRAIRDCAAELFGDKGAQTRILYGGSMNAKNAAGLLAEGDIDGGLLGSSSLDAAEFAEIIRIAAASGGELI
ncbi:MAG: triose-phosphate isomerase [Oscillospiraceae bacterium]|jgi:triosephosphate isomerase|nr:triose-phosphate isomerase [Oscillospiraceae bacterium]